jgi:hypothetical protein
MDIEFKFIGPNRQLVVKQARPYSFGHEAPMGGVTCGVHFRQNVLEAAGCSRYRSRHTVRTHLRLDLSIRGFELCCVGMPASRLRLGGRGAFLLSVCVLHVGTACSVLIDAQRQQCKTDDDCRNRGAAFTGSVCNNSVCVRPGGSGDGGTDASADGSKDGGINTDAKRDTDGTDTRADGTNTDLTGYSGGTDSEEAGATDAAPVPPKLVGWWKLDEGEGVAVNDSSGSGNNGIVVNTAEWGPGTLILSATNKAVVEIPVLSSDFPTLDGAKTVSLWVNYDRVPPTTVNFVVLTDGVDFHVQFVVRDGVLRVTGCAGASIFMTPTPPPSPSAWHHLAYTYDGAGTPVIYVDGVASGTWLVAVPPARNTAYVRIGSWTTNSTSAYFEHLDGSVGDVRVYNYALSQDDVTALYSAGRQGAPKEVDASAADTGRGNPVDASVADMPSGP